MATALSDLEREELYQLRDMVEELQDQLEHMRGILLPEKLDMRFDFNLTPQESKLLVCLMKAKGATCSKERLLNWLYSLRADQDGVPEIKIIDVFVCKLRKKIRLYGFDIETIWGQGYAMHRDQTVGILALKDMTLQDLDM